MTCHESFCTCKHGKTPLYKNGQLDQIGDQDISQNIYCDYRAFDRETLYSKIRAVTVEYHSNDPSKLDFSYENKNGALEITKLLAHRRASVLSHGTTPPFEKLPLVSRHLGSEMGDP